MRKLEIGPQSRGKLGPDWETLDVLPGPHVDHLAANPCNSLADISSNAYDLVYMSHVLEHIAWYDSVFYLREVHRVLRAEGWVEVWVPDFHKIIMAASNRGRNGPDRWKGPGRMGRRDRQHLAMLGEFDSFLWALGRLFSYQRANGGPTDFHKAAFDEQHLGRCLQAAGFRNLRKLDEPRGYSHGYINLGLTGQKADT